MRIWLTGTVEYSMLSQYPPLRLQGQAAWNNHVGKAEQSVDHHSEWWKRQTQWTVYGKSEGLHLTPVDMQRILFTVEHTQVAVPRIIFFDHQSHCNLIDNLCDLLCRQGHSLYMYVSLDQQPSHSPLHTGACRLWPATTSANLLLDAIGLVATGSYYGYPESHSCSLKSHVHGYDAIGVSVAVILAAESDPHMVWVYVM